MSDNKWVYRVADHAWMVGFRDSSVYPGDAVNYALQDLGDGAPFPDPIAERRDAAGDFRRPATADEMAQSLEELAATVADAYLSEDTEAGQVNRGMLFTLCKLMIDAGVNLNIVDFAAVPFYPLEEAGLMAFVRAGIISYMAPRTRGPYFAGTATSSAGPDTNAWTNPSNATGAPDAVFATCSIPAGEISDFLMLTNYAFDVPTDAVVRAATLIVRGKTSGGAADIHQEASQFLVASAVYGSAVVQTNETWSTTSADIPIGHPLFAGFISSDPAIVNDSGYGIGLCIRNNSGGTVTISIDSVAIIAHFIGNV